MKFVLTDGRMLPVVVDVVDKVQDAMVEHFKDAIIAFLVALVDVIQQLSYSLALLGGGICLIVYAIAKVERAKKVGLVLVLIHALLSFL